MYGMPKTFKKKQMTVSLWCVKIVRIVDVSIVTREPGPLSIVTSEETPPVFHGSAEDGQCYQGFARFSVSMYEPMMLLTAP